MDIDNLSPDQLQKVFKLCDMMSLQDLYVATTILQNYGWDVEKAINEIAYSKQQQNKKEMPKTNVMDQQQQPKKEEENVNSNTNHNQQNYSYFVDFSEGEDQDPYKIKGQQAQEDMVDYQDYEYEYPETELQMKKKMFEQSYFSELPLQRAISQPDGMTNQLQKSKLLATDYHNHRHSYQSNLLRKAQQLCNRILQTSTNKGNSKHLYQANNRKIITNKKFIVYLHKVYKSKINFTFGTFMLNLIRSYLDEKYLLVFILHDNTQQNVTKVVEKILTQPQIARFVNANFISYGMFDNSDDYEIVQKYVPLRDLPTFAIFKYDKKQQKEHFISSYPLLSNESQNFLEWIAKSMGITLKKKESLKKSPQNIVSQPAFEYEKISDILKQQNWQYDQIEKLYNMKRTESRFNKDRLKEKQNQTIQMRKHFQSTPQLQIIPGKSIQIKFRMPISGQSKLRVFDLEQKVLSMFNFIEAFCQDQFQEPYCQFDLTQTFPTLSLKDKKQKYIKQIFQDTDRQNIIVKQI